MQKPDINKDLEFFQPSVRLLKSQYEKILTPGVLTLVKQSIRGFVSDGIPENIARDIALMPVLGSVCDIIQMTRTQKSDLSTIAKVYFEVGEYFNLDWLRVQAGYIPANDPWTAEALDGVIDGLYRAQSGLSARVLKDMGGKPKSSSSKKDAGSSAVAQWVEGPGAQAKSITPMMADLRKAGSLDLPMLVIAEQKLRKIYSDA
jgi:glutamate dehydrogenase